MSQVGLKATKKRVWYKFPFVPPDDEEKVEEMSKKLLIVDDDNRFLIRWAELAADIAQELGYEIIIANGVADGLAKIAKEHPEVIITDKDMPDGTGNDVAREAHQLYTPRIAGITGGNPEQFDAQYIDHRLSKSITDDQYQQLVRDLLENKPKQSGQPRPKGPAGCGGGIYNLNKNNLTPVEKIVYDFYEIMTPIDILLQGYILAEQIKRDEVPAELVEAVELSQIKPDYDKVKDLFNLANSDVDADYVTKCLDDLLGVARNSDSGLDARLNMSIGGFVHPVAEGCLRKIIKGELPEYDEANALHDAYVRLAEDR